jgi:hypothetical protein
MILSVSRRTDIPAFYSRWFINRLEAGYVLVRNPMNPNLAGKIPLTPDIVDCIVFWTKNPRPLMDRLDRLNDYRYYFLFTITAYGPGLERHLPPKSQVIDAFIELSQKTGKEKVVWRYDPILLSDTIDADFHFRNFAAIARRLHGHTERCIISFLDMYKKCQRNLKGLNIKPELESREMLHLAGELRRLASDQGIDMKTCAEDIDLSAAGIGHGACIDEELLTRVTGCELEVKKDKHQRKTCRCVESVDIGTYNTCPHNCLYCYANSDAGTVKRNAARHDPRSPLLTGWPPTDGSVKIVERTARSIKKIQKRLF